MANVESFKSEFKEIVRSNRFRLSGPAVPPKPELCLSAQVPAISLATTEYRDGKNSAPWKIPYDSILSEAVLTFRDDENMTNRSFFEDWYEEIVTSNGFGYFDDFTRAYLKIEQLNRDDSVAYSWRLIDVYPLSLSEIQYDNSSQNEVTTWSVSLAYHDADWIG